MLTLQGVFLPFPAHHAMFSEIYVGACVVYSFSVSDSIIFHTLTRAYLPYVVIFSSPFLSSASSPQRYPLLYQLSCPHRVDQLYKCSDEEPVVVICLSTKDEKTLYDT